MGSSRRKTAGFLFGFLAAVLSCRAGAETSFEQIFCSQNGVSDLSKCKIPSDPVALQAALAEAAEQRAQPPIPFNLDQNRIAQAVLVPQGRSLQADTTDYSNPRVLFGFPPNIQGTDPDGLPFKSKNPLSGELFMAYSPNAKSLEIISYDRRKGRYDFLRVDNYPANPTVVPQNGKVCISCHQAGTPIFTRAPWNETNSSLKVAKKLCENVKPKGIPKYLGIPFAESCPPKEAPPPAPPGSEALGRRAATVLDVDVRLANRRLQARNACRTMCKGDLDCRKLLLEAALLNPRSMTSIARLDPRDPKEDEETLEGATLGPPSSKGLTASPQDAALVTLDAKLQTKLAQSWDPTAYSYVSSVLADRDPLATRAAHPFVTLLRGKGTSRGTSTGPNAAFGRTYDEHDTAPNTAPTPPPTPTAASFILSPDPGPRAARPRTGDIPKDLAGLYAMDVAFDCLGFGSEDSQTIKGCAAKDPQLIQKILASSELNPLLQDWPLAEDNQPSAARDTVMAIARKACGLPFNQGDPCPYLHSMLSENQQKGIQSALGAAKKIAAVSPKDILARNCASCHAPHSGKHPLPVDDPAAMKAFASRFLGAKDHDKDLCWRLSKEADASHRMPLGADMNESEQSTLSDFLGCTKK